MNNDLNLTHCISFINDRNIILLFCVHYTPLCFPLHNVSGEYSCATRPSACKGETECVDQPGGKSRCDDLEGTNL